MGCSECVTFGDFIDVENDVAARDVKEPTMQHCVTLFQSHGLVFVFSQPFRARRLGYGVIVFIVWSDDERHCEEETKIEIFPGCLAVLHCWFFDISH